MGYVFAKMAPKTASSWARGRRTELQRHPARLTSEQPMKGKKSVQSMKNQRACSHEGQEGQEGQQEGKQGSDRMTRTA